MYHCPLHTVPNQGVPGVRMGGVVNTCIGRVVHVTVGWTGNGGIPVMFRKFGRAHIHRNFIAD